MDTWDVLLTLLYVILSLGIALFIRSRYKDQLIYRKYFIPGLLAKIIGGISFALVYTYYYTYGGDTKSYFYDASILFQYFIDSPLNFIKILLADEQLLRNEYYTLASDIRFQLGTPEWFMDKITGVVNIFGFDSYFSTTVIFAVLSYVGIWKFFEVLYSRYPEAHRSLAFSILFVPSVFFWGSGIMKDCVVIGFLGLLMYYTNEFISKRGVKRWWSLIFILICSYVIFNIKAYVVVSLLPALIIWAVMNIRDKISNKVVKVLVLPLLLVLSIVFVGLSIQTIGQYTSKYNIEQVLQTADSMQNWHYVEGDNTSDSHGRGSSYTLGEYEPTLAGIASMFFPSVVVTFYRPYLWEVKNIAMLAASIESTIILLFSIFIFLGLGLFKVLRILNQDSFLLMALSFALFFGFAVGFTSYNFGALVRYKIPCMPFYLFSLFILRHKVKKLKEVKRMSFEMRKRRNQELLKRAMNLERWEATE